MPDIENKQTYEETKKEGNEKVLEENKNKDLNEDIKKAENNTAKLKEIEDKEKIEKEKEGNPDENLSKALDSFNESHENGIGLSTESMENRTLPPEKGTGLLTEPEKGISIDNLSVEGIKNYFLGKALKEQIDEIIGNRIMMDTNSKNVERGSTEYFENEYKSAISSLSETFPEIQDKLEDKKINIILEPEEEYNDRIFVGIDKDGINTIRYNRKINYTSSSFIRRNETGCSYENIGGMMLCIDDIKSKPNKCEITIK